MSLASQIASDVSDVFMNTSDFAVTVTYTRGGHTIQIPAIVEPSLFNNDQSLGITKVETRRYLVEASTLVFGETVTLPEYGDKITENDRTYIVPKSRDNLPYEYADEDRHLVRINTTFLSKR